MEQLKSCPFCSEEAKIKLAKKYYVGITIWCECEKCHVKTRGYSPNLKEELTTLENIDLCRNKAIEEKNRRRTNA